MKTHISASVLAIALSTSSAYAQENPASTQDMQCVAFGFLMSGDSDPGARNAGQGITLYYLGRMDAREPGSVQEGRLRSAVAALNGIDLRVLGARCATEFQPRAMLFADLSHRLDEEEAPRQ